MKFLFEDIQEIRFVVVHGANPGSKVAFEPGVRSVGIGRAVDNEIVINDQTVSRNHVRVDIREDGYTVCDLGSSSGTEKMGFHVGLDPEPLQSGEELKIGDTILRFEVVTKKGALRRATAREAAAEAGPSSGSPIQNALAKVGLRSTVVQLVAAACAVAIGAMLLWPSAPKLPPQSNAPLPLNFDASIGFNSADRSHLDGAVFKIATDADGLGIYFEHIGGSDVEIRARARTFGKLPATREWRRYELVTIPRAIAGGGAAEIEFDHLGYSPANGDVDPATAPQWALSKMWAARVVSTASSPSLLSSELKAARSLFDRLADDPVNRYTLIKSLRASLLGLMKIAGMQALLVKIPIGEELKEKNLGEIIDGAEEELEKEHLSQSLERVALALSQAEGEFEREYRRNQNAVLLAQRRGASSEQKSALRAIVAMIPDTTDPRQRWATTELRKFP